MARGCRFPTAPFVVGHPIEDTDRLRYTIVKSFFKGYVSGRSMLYAKCDAYHVIPFYCDGGEDSHIRPYYV